MQKKRGRKREIERKKKSMSIKSFYIATALATTTQYKPIIVLI